MNEKALVIGSGGREHALVKYISDSPQVSEVYCAPGNGGTESFATNVDLGIKDAEGTARFCVDNQIDLTVVGPDDALEAGVVDALEEEGLTVFGPNRDAARLEWDKIYANSFMEHYDIPHPRGWSFSEVTPAKRFLNKVHSSQIVIKANGLAGGKGVKLPDSLKEAEAALTEIMIDEKFGSAGKSVLIQERLKGKELSVFAICSGEEYALLPLCQDYKRRDNEDKGLNTGGMGSVAPANIVDHNQLAVIEQEIIQPTLKGMVEEGAPFKGVLYTGIMLEDSGPQVIEYNARFGDPECQALLPLIDEDIYQLLDEAARGNVIKPRLKNLASALVVIASGNYPEGRASGEKIRGLDSTSHVAEVFHAGTECENGKYKAVGGRVLNIVGLSHDIRFALNKAYSSIGPQGIHFDNMHYRKDIGSNL